jgi:hypothetical protein
MALTTIIGIWAVVGSANAPLAGTSPIVFLRIQVDDEQPIVAGQHSGDEITVKGEKHRFTLVPVVTDREKGVVDVTLKIGSKDRVESGTEDARQSSPVMHLTKDEPERSLPMDSTQVKIRLLSIRDHGKR